MSGKLLSHLICISMLNEGIPCSFRKDLCIHLPLGYDMRRNFNRVGESVAYGVHPFDPFDSSVPIRNVST